ncbi:Lysine ketoglutarate reductase trans-splicing related 1 [Zostera marina]|uniref:Lysine ketoglutarate reductase trans-splicing related 1 n=1 Tax=Zostera marina TaxID=29655 RepID=A0A0K9NJ80_ZOSMR|nr:Lysine ketoglutarate reductase trans-splicing related 1 [Zostera marina]
MRLILSTIIGMILGFFLGTIFPQLTTFEVDNNINNILEAKNPRGAELLPPGIIRSESDYYLRRLWGNPNEDLPMKQKYLVAFTVGAKQKQYVNAAVKKFSSNFTILLFHYDGLTDEWDEFEWSKQAIHISVRRQAKWWYAKRFLHPDIIAAYEYIFIWDEDLGVENFDGEEYLKIVKRHGLEISQPGLDSNKRPVWLLTKRQIDKEIHRFVDERSGRCATPYVPPCAAFVEIMAPVFSRKAWRCVWHMIQNDLVHGWGLDLSVRRCLESAYEKIGIVDSQYIVHLEFPTLRNQSDVKLDEGKQPWHMVRERCNHEWNMFKGRLRSADQKYFKQHNMSMPNATYF